MNHMKGDVILLAVYSWRLERFANWFPASRGDHWWVSWHPGVICLESGIVTRKLASAMLTTFSNGCLGSHNDEERSEMRYVMRIARPRESLKF